MEYHVTGKMIDYDKLYELLHKRLKASHAELHYWIRKNDIPAYWVDFRNQLNEMPLVTTYNDGIYPEYHFYSLNDVTNFIPKRGDRLITASDLYIRGWSDNYVTHLRKACEVGILKLFDKERQSFTHTKYFPQSNSNVSWVDTIDGEETINDPHSFYRLEEIIYAERILLRFPKDKLEKELRGFNNEKG